MNRTAIITFMRCQPCVHKGHELILNAMRQEWLMEPLESTYFIYLSKTQDKKNPVSYETKLNISKQLVPIHSSRFVTDHPGNIISILHNLDDNYTNLIFYCGPDRVAAFSNLIKSYNNIEYDFKSIKVLSVGVRDDSAIDVTGISGTKMRAAVQEQNMDEFITGLPISASVTVKKDVFYTLSAEMHLQQRA